MANIVVSSGITSNGLMLLSGTAMVVDRGGIASNTVVSNGGLLSGAGGKVLDTIISGGGVEVLGNLSTDKRTTIYSGGLQEGNSGATASGTKVESGGVQFLSRGATGDFGSVFKGGAIILSSGATLTGETVKSGGVIVDLGGAVISDLALEGGTVLSTGVAVLRADAGLATYSASADGNALGSYPGGETQAWVLVNGTADNFTVGAFAVLTDSGGLVRDASIRSGGTTALNAGTLMGGTLFAGGVLLSASGAHVSGLSIGSGAILTIAGANGDIVDAGGVQVDGAGAPTTATLVEGGGREVQSSGITDESTVLGLQIVTGSGVGSNTEVASGGTQLAGAGATVSNTTVQSGGFLIVSNATAVSTTVDSGGYIAVFDGGHSLSPALQKGAIQIKSGVIEVTASGSGVYFASAVAQRSIFGAELWVLNSGLLESGTLLGSGTTDALTQIETGGRIISETISGGTLLVLVGGSASAITDLEGEVSIKSGAIASDITVGSGGTVSVLANATVSDVNVQGGGYLAISGQVTGGTIAGYALVESKGVLQDATLTSGGSVVIQDGYVLSGRGAARGLSVMSGATLQNSGVVSGTTVFAGGTFTEFNSDSATIVSSGGSYLANAGTATQLVVDGGTAAFNFLSRSDFQGVASLLIENGGSVSDASAQLSDVSDIGGTINIYDATVEGITVSSGQVFLEPYRFGSQTRGANVSGATIDQGGTIVDNNFTLINAIVSFGGLLQISGGSLTDAVIASGGLALARGTITGATKVEDAGALILANGAHIASVTSQTGGIVASTGIVLASSDAAPSYVGSSLPSDGYTLQSGTAYVLSGGIFQGATIGARGHTSVFSGGVVRTSEIATGGIVSLYGGSAESIMDAGLLNGLGHVNEVTVLSGGLAFISGTYLGPFAATYASASNTTISSGGVVSAAVGVLFDTSVSSGGLLMAGYGGTLSGATIASGGLAILSQATGVDFTVDAGGVADVEGGFNDAIVDGILVVSGHSDLFGITLNAGGTAIVLADGSIESSVLNGGTTISAGVLVNSSGVSITVTSNAGTIAGGFAQLVLASANAQSTVVRSGGIEKVFSGGTATNLTVSSGGSLDVLSGGTVSGGQLTNGSIFLSRGGTITGLSISNGGSFDVVSGSFGLVDGATTLIDEGRLTGGTIAGGGMLFANGSVIQGVTAASGGFISLGYERGSSASGLVAVSGGIIDGRGTLDDTVVSAGGTVSAELYTVLSGGSIGLSGSATLSQGDLLTGVIISGGKAILNGATATSDSVLAGGKLVLINFESSLGKIVPAAALSDTVTSGGTLVLSGGTIEGLTFGLQATVDLAALAWAGSSHGTTQLEPNNQLRIIEGGGTAFIGLAGNYAGETFFLRPDGSGGTDVVLGAGMEFSAQSDIVSGVTFMPFSAFASHSTSVRLTGELGAANVYARPDETLIVHVITQL